MSISWIILGILALGVLGILAIYFFYVLEESYAKWSWPKALVKNKRPSKIINIINRK